MVLQPFVNAPFPYHGKLPNSDVDFLDAMSGNRRGHTSQRGGIYWEDTTYSDNRVLLALPKGFDVEAQAAIVVYFHGNGATLERDVLRRQAVVDQLQDSGLNAALVAPQFAVDALDSSAGRFWRPGAFAAFMEEAAARLATLCGASGARRIFEAAPIVLVAYSGGYDPAAYVLAADDDGKRLKGVVLLDGVFGEEDKFASWIVRHHKSAFFFSAFSPSAADGNNALEALLTSKGIRFSPGLPSKLAVGTVAFLAAPREVNHNDFVTSAWEDRPLQSVLARVALG